MSRKLNVAIIGQGRSGMGIHGEYMLRDEAKELFNVVAVVDWMEVRRNRAKELWNCDVYENYTDLFGRDDIDLVINSSLSYLHASISTDLLNHGFNVVVEKPFGKYTLECEKAIEAAKKNGKMLSVFQQSRFAPYYEEVKSVIESGVLGKIQQISIKFSGFKRRWDWQCSNRYYAGALLNTGPHPLDQALDLLNTDDMPNVFSVLKIANSSGDAEDYVKLILTYPDRPLIDLEINGVDAYCDHLYDIYGERGSLRAGHTKIEYKYHDACPIPPITFETMTQEDGVSPAFCSEELNWHEVERDIKGTVFVEGTGKYYKNIYNHIVNGEELAIKPEKILQQIRVIELVHAQNPMPTLY